MRGSGQAGREQGARRRGLGTVLQKYLACRRWQAEVLPLVLQVPVVPALLYPMGHGTPPAMYLFAWSCKTPRQIEDRSSRPTNQPSRAERRRAPHAHSGVAASRVARPSWPETVEARAGSVEAWKRRRRRGKEPSSAWLRAGVRGCWPWPLAGAHGLLAPSDQTWICPSLP